jgi:hypothetical protein
MARTAFVVNMRCARKCGTWPVAVSRRTTSSKSSAAPRKHCASVSVVSSIAAWPRPMRQSPAFCSRPPRPATSQRDRALPIGERSEDSRGSLGQAEAGCHQPGRRRIKAGVEGAAHDRRRTVHPDVDPRQKLLNLKRRKGIVATRHGGGGCRRNRRSSPRSRRARPARRNPCRWAVEGGGRRPGDTIPDHRTRQSRLSDPRHAAPACRDIVVKIISSLLSPARHGIIANQRSKRYRCA